MRRVLIAIGLILLPLPASAAALSPWVDAVINRAQTGINFAQSLPAGNCDDPVVLQTIENNFSVIRSSRTTAENLTSEGEQLGARTLCTESDRRLIADKMQDIYDAMSAAVLACNDHASDVLREDYEFLVGAYQSFLRGAVDPSFADNRLRYNYPFHDSVLYDAGSGPVFDSGSTMPLCPFTTDYGPHAIGYVPSGFGGGVAAAGGPSFDVKSYGCDASVLSTLPASFATESSDYLDFLNQTDSLASDLYTLISQTLFNIDSTVAFITSNPPPQAPPAAASAPPHATAVGCLRPPSPEQGGSGDPAAMEALLAAYPDYFDLKNLRQQDAGGGATFPTYGPTADLTLPEGTLFRPVADKSSIMDNVFTLLESFSNRKSLMGYERPLPNSFLGAGGNSDMFTFLGLQVDKPQELPSIAANIERQTALYESVDRDSYERTKEAAKPLETAVQSLADLTQNFLPKKYIPNVVYFLLRSCVDGHCQKTLDTVAKRIFNKYCHPYVSGDYTDPEAVDKCYCTGQFDSEDYCSGGQLHLDTQPDPPPLQCGESTSTVPEL